MRRTPASIRARARCRPFDRSSVVLQPAVQISMPQLSDSSSIAVGPLGLGKPGILQQPEHELVRIFAFQATAAYLPV